jgi:hypothetical protein
MNEKIKQTTLEASADNDAALLAEYGFSELPDVFAMREGRTVYQEREPCYECMTDGFYGTGQAGTWYMEGEIMVTDIVPNSHMKPLNRASALRWAKWHKALPSTQTTVSIADISEAMTRLAAHPNFLNLTPEERSKQAMTLADHLRYQRELKEGRSIPSLGHNFFQPASGGNAPPLLGAKMAHMNQLMPGQTSAPVHVSNAGRSATRRAGRTEDVLGGPSTGPA